MASISPINSSETLGRQRAAHLLRRTTFGPTKQDIDTFSGLTINQALNQLLEIRELPDPPVDPATGDAWVNPRSTGANSEQDALKRYVCCWWGDLMKNEVPSIIEKMVWFYHTHFTTIMSRVRESEAIYYQLALFRYYALGNFKEIAKKIVYDNAMLYNLDGRLNIKGKPQENFAREYLELYTIGKGEQVDAVDYSNYTEQDVKEGARLLSGFDVDTSFENLDEETGVALGIIKGAPNASQHDDEPKTFSHRFQNQTITTPANTAEGVLQELDEFAEMIFTQEETAKYICRRLYRYFVYYDVNEEIENDIITPLAETFRSNDYELLPVIDQLLRSQHFFDEDNAVTTDDNIGAIIKSPLELTVGTLRFFNVQMPDKETELEKHYEAWNTILFELLQNQGLEFYEPFDVVGYDAYHQVPGFNRNWITPNNLMQRYQLSNSLVNGIRNENDELLLQLNIFEYCLNAGIDFYNGSSIVQHFVDYLFPEDISQERFDYFFEVLLGDEKTPVELREPDYQYQDDWDNVMDQMDLEFASIYVTNLVSAMISSPEYQLM